MAPSDNIQLPNLFNYLDFRIYLRDFRDYMKKSDPGFTNAHICHLLGQKNSSGYFNNVIGGRIKVGATLTERFFDLLNLSVNEEKYFRALVNYNQSSTLSEKEFYLDQLIRFNNSPSHKLNRQAQTYYRHWQYAVIRALLDIVDFSNDYSILLDTLLLPLTQEDVEDAIKVLKDLKLIAKNDDGYWKPTKKAISSGSEIERELIKYYQAKCLELSSTMILNDNAAHQKVSTLTISASNKTIEQITDRINLLKSEIRSLILADDDESEKLYQLNIHLFPQVK